MGGSCDTDSREKFSEFCRETISGKSVEHPIPASVGEWDCPMTEEGLVYDYCYEVLFILILKSLKKSLFLQSKSYFFLFHSLKEEAAGFTGMNPSQK